MKKENYWKIQDELNEFYLTASQLPYSTSKLLWILNRPIEPPLTSIVYNEKSVTVKITAGLFDLSETFPFDQFISKEIELEMNDSINLSLLNFFAECELLINNTVRETWFPLTVAYIETSDLIGNNFRVFNLFCPKTGAAYVCNIIDNKLYLKLSFLVVGYFGN